MSKKYGKRYKEEEILRILKEAEEAGRADEVLRKYGVSMASYYKWRQKYGGMNLSEMKRLKELELENSRLKRIVADQALDIVVLKDINSKKW
jgi:putative transposase